MPLKVIANGATKDAESAQVTVGNAQKRVVRIDAWNGSAWKLAQSFASPLSLTVSPSEVTGAESSLSPVLVTSGTAYATPAGGTAPYTYAWTKVSGDTLTVTSPSRAFTAFQATLSANDLSNAVYRCTVTDKNGLTAQDTVNVTLSNEV